MAVLRHRPTRPARTILEQLIRERQETFEEFAEYAEKFARDHGESGTLSLRHLQRLVAGRRVDGERVGNVRPATARLLERIFGVSIVELLGPPAWEEDLQPGAAHALMVAVAVVVKESEVLIVHRRSDSKMQWQFPSGIVKPGDTVEAVAIRETLGETNVHCSIAYRLGVRIHPVTRVVCKYALCTYLSGDVANNDVAENIAACWVDKSKLTLFVPERQIFQPVLEALNTSGI